MSTADEPLPILRRLGEKVRARRTSLALTMKELAKASGVSQRLLVSLEAGKANISVARLDDVARALGTTPAALLQEDRVAEVVALPVGMSRKLALLGLRGAGKSAIGDRSAARLGVPFVELDSRIVERAGMSLESLFAMHGTDYYRRLEREELERLLREADPCVIATGGGIVTSHGTYELLRQQTQTVFLRATPEDHWNRVVAQGDVRPMANRTDAMAELRRILMARRALYERAAHVVDTSALGLEKSVDAVVRIATKRAERTGVARAGARAPGG